MPNGVAQIDLQLLLVAMDEEWLRSVASGSASNVGAEVDGQLTDLAFVSTLHENLFADISSFLIDEGIWEDSTLFDALQTPSGEMEPFLLQRALSV